MNAKNSSKFSKIYHNHVISTTYFFQVGECDDAAFPYHKPLRVQKTIKCLSWPCPKWSWECPSLSRRGRSHKKILPSVLDDVEKSAQGIPFNPTSQTAKDVGFIVRCEEYQKPRLVHSKLKLKIEESQGAQRIMKELSYLYVGTREWYKKFLANILCAKIILVH